MEKTKNRKRQNIYFSQTPKEFRSAKQTQLYEHIKQNIPYRIFAYTKEKIFNVASVAHQKWVKFKINLPKGAKKVSSK